MFEKEAEERARKLEEKQTLGVYDNDEDLARDEGFNNGEVCGYENGFQDGAEFGYNKAKEEMQEQDYSLVDFVMQYENGKFKCKYKSGKEFESVDGKTWKEIVLPKESE